MTTSEPSGYDQSRARGVQALEAGRLEEARRHFAAALAVARQGGDAALVDHAVCSEAAVAIELGDADSSLPALREILVRNQRAESCALAARGIARAYELRKEYRKSLFYARVARDRAEAAGSQRRLAAALNQIGNALVGLSCFEEAAGSYRAALELVPAGGDPWYLLCLANLGYCRVVLGERREGMALLYRVLRHACRHADRRLEMMARLDLCFAHLELGRHRVAERHGRRGLALAEMVGEVGELKNALYLVGECAVLTGRLAEGRAVFGELQSRFYPDQPKLVEFLVTVDIRKTVNLRA